MRCQRSPIFMQLILYDETSLNIKLKIWVEKSSFYDQKESAMLDGLVYHSTAFKWESLYVKFWKKVLIIPFKCCS